MPHRGSLTLGRSIARRPEGPDVIYVHSGRSRELPSFPFIPANALRAGPFEHTIMTQAFDKPAIAIPVSDHERLGALADSLTRRNPTLADQLFAELERADVLADDAANAVVRMGSMLEYRTESGDVRTVQLVFPGDEDIAKGRISVLTPIGVALIGLSAGDTMEWVTPDGRSRKLTVTRIEPALVAA